jgi:hypothetical protein
MSCVAKPRQGRQKLAHGASHGNATRPGHSPGGAEGTAYLPPLTGLFWEPPFSPWLTPWANLLRPWRGNAPEAPQ